MVLRRVPAADVNAADCGETSHAEAVVSGVVLTLV